MKRLLSTSYSASAFNLALLILRLAAGSLIVVSHGYKKLVGFNEIQPKFMSFLGLSSGFSLSLSIFAEFFCGILIILGLLTRLAAIPLVINMCVVVFMANNGNFFGKGELGTLFLASFLAILLVGPGRVSVDGMINK